MKALFVDTTGWIMLADESESQHEAARSFRDQWLARSGSLVSSNYMMDETLTLLRVRLGLDTAERWWDSGRRQPASPLGMG